MKRYVPGWIRSYRRRRRPSVRQLSMELAKFRALHEVNHPEQLAAQLIDPSGKENIIVTVTGAIEWCRKHPDWNWRSHPD